MSAPEPEFDDAEEELRAIRADRDRHREALLLLRRTVEGNDHMADALHIIAVLGTQITVGDIVDGALARRVKGTEL